jgi:proteasome assembly chaperone (PAC2) family protein
MSEPQHVRWLSQPALRSPVIIAAFTGWNDAGDAASSAVRHLIDAWGAERLAEIDPEEFTDFATIRPLVRLADGTSREIVWPSVWLWHVSAPGSDVILMLGPEPSLRWRHFTEQMLGVARSVGASMVLTLGALLADVAHSRPVQVIGTSTDISLMDRFDLQRSRYEGPTGIVGVLHQACADSGMPSASLWAAVPAYASQEPSPKAALALLQRACEMIGTPAPVAGLAADVAAYEVRITSLVGEEPDLEGYVRRLEQMTDAGFTVEDDDEDDDIFDDDDDDDDADDTVGGELTPDERRSVGGGSGALPARPARRLSALPGRRQGSGLAPNGRAGRIERRLDRFAVDRGERHRAPPLHADRRPRQVIGPEPTHVARLERVALAAGHRWPGSGRGACTCRSE